MKKFILLLILLTIAALTLPAQEKVALVIGNSAYEHVAPLKNPLNDAQDIGATLENLGFSVTRALDASRGEIQQAVDRFQQASSRKGNQSGPVLLLRPRGGIRGKQLHNPRECGDPQ